MNPLERQCCDGLCQKGEKCPLIYRAKRSLAEAFPEANPIEGPQEVADPFSRPPLSVDDKVLIAILIILGAGAIAMVLTGGSQ